MTFSQHMNSVSITGNTEGKKRPLRQCNCNQKDANFRASIGVVFQCQLRKDLRHYLFVDCQAKPKI